MNNTTKNWIILAMKANELQRTCGYNFASEEHARQAVRDIAAEAASIGFSLGVRDRWFEMTTILLQLEENYWMKGMLTKAHAQLWIDGYQPPTKKDLGKFR